MLERILILIFANIAFFGKTLNYKYASDDIPAAMRPKDPNKWKHLLNVLEGSARSRPDYDHILTLAIHIAICIFIYLAFGSSDISFLAAVLFAFNPANSQASVWISGRSYALPTLGLLVSMVFPLIAPLALLGGAWYNAGFATPLLMGLTKNWWILAFVPFIWLIHLSRFRSNVGEKMKQELFAEDRSLKPEKLILFTKTMGFYFTLGLIPFKNTFYHSFLQSASGSRKHEAYTWNDRFFAIGILVIGSAIGYLVTQPWSLVSFAIIWWMFCIAPFCNLMRIHQEIAERYMYQANVGLMFVLASILVTHPVLAAVWVTMFAVKMYFYMDCYRDDYFLIEMACMSSPEAWFSWHVRALKRWDQKSYAEAIILWTMARLVSPNEMKLCVNLATCLAMAGHKKEADAFIEEAKKWIPGGQEELASKMFKDWEEGKMAIVT